MSETFWAYSEEFQTYYTHFEDDGICPNCKGSHGPLEAQITDLEITHHAGQCQKCKTNLTVMSEGYSL